MEQRAGRQGVAGAGGRGGKLIGAGGEAWNLYCCWRFLASHPAVRWRALHETAPAPPEPWPGRVDAFMVACAIEAGNRENDLADIVKALAGGK